MICLFFPSAPLHADIGPTPPDKPGLIWNRSGLPAVFPLQVKTTADQNYFLTLIDKPTGEAVLAAYVIGGQFFKILVPPGTFTLRFTPPDIENTDAQHMQVDGDPDVFDLSEELVFRTLGLSTKAGHVVDLTDNPGDLITRVKVKPQYICQSIATDFSRTTLYRELSYHYPDGFRDPVDDIRRRRYSTYHQRSPYALRWPGFLRLDYSKFSVRSSYCD